MNTAESEKIYVDIEGEAQSKDGTALRFPRIKGQKLEQGLGRRLD